MSSNDRKEPRSGATQYEYRTSDVAPKRAHTVFGIAPGVTQPFDAFKDANAAPERPAAAPDFAKSTQRFAPSIQPVIVSSPPPPPAQPSAVQVSVARMQGIGQQTVGRQADEPRASERPYAPPTRRRMSGAILCAEFAPAPRMKYPAPQAIASLAGELREERAERFARQLWRRVIIGRG